MEINFRKLKNQALVTYLFMAVIIAYYLYMLLRFGTTTRADVLIIAGAKFNPAIIYGQQWWRLLVAGIIHIGFEHLFMNSLSIYFIGQELEYLLGHGRFLCVLLGSIFGGNLLSFAFNESIAAGASTGIFGLFAAFISLSYLYPHSSALKARSANYQALLLINVAMGLLSSGVDNFGHIGGAISGGLLTIALDRRTNHSIQTRYRFLAALAVLLIWFLSWKIGCIRWS